MLSLTFALLLAPLHLPSGPAPAVGPPFICHQLEIGDARSLPWKKGVEPSADYQRARLVADVADLLKTQTNLIVRMETLRLPAIYARDDRALAWELLGRTGLLVLEQESVGARASTTWFDVGVLAMCWDQLDLDLGFRAGVGEGFDGYGYLAKALDLARAEKNDQIGTIEFAAALCGHPAMRRGGGDRADIDRYWGHVDAAQARSRVDALLAKNVDAHIALWKQHFPRNGG